MKKWLLSVLLLPTLCFGQTIKEKKESFLKNESGLDESLNEQLVLVNEELECKRSLLKDLYTQAHDYYLQGTSDENYTTLLEKIATIKKEIAEIELMWRKETENCDPYALWHQPETTLSQLVTDYGSHEYIYLIPPDIGAYSLSLNSNLPIPRESWGICLELILNQYGVGIRQLNPYLRELYLLKNDASCIKCVTSSEKDLELFSGQERVCFVLSCSYPDPKIALHFLQKFSNPNTTTLHQIQGNIFLVSTVDSIKELLKLYAFSKIDSVGQEYQLVALNKVDAKEMLQILDAAFGKTPEESALLRALPLSSLPRSLFLSGSRNEITKALKLIEDVESQIEAPNAKTLFWYTTKHSEAEELAALLAKVYDLLIENPSSKETHPVLNRLKIEKPPVEKEPGLNIQPASVAPLVSGRTAHRTSDGQNNFIVDKKTGSIIMVVEQSALPKLKDLLKKLDVPKKMVQIEVLLFEKKVTNQNKSGLNLLRLGQHSTSSGTKMDLDWNGKGNGILEFLISHAKGSTGIPSFDLAYHFLLGQEDIQINASPSVTTVNQTPATIAIVEEISINTGVDSDKNKERNSYSRAQYGITIQITPTINVSDEEGEGEAGFITLDTDITFDTTKRSVIDRPDVTRRHIKNHVRIADGETVILGGLRRKNCEDKKDSIPFLGEIPGIGKLFSTTDLYDSSTEMFIFITPKIIADSVEEAKEQRKEELKKRPGDIPEFIHELMEAKSREKKKLFEGSMTALFGRDDGLSSPFKKERREFDGRE